MKDKEDKVAADEAVGADEGGQPEETQSRESPAAGNAKTDASCEERLAAAERDAEELRDQALRAAAELENMRKRTAKEVERVRKYALESFAMELLAVKDNLERSMDDKTGTDQIESMREGVHLTLKSLDQVFAKFGIEELSPLGQAFDPELHQAMSTVETDEHEPNTVAEVVQKGYLLNGRLIRPAMVMVAKAKTADGGGEKAS